MPGSDNRLLLASIHDVSPRSEREVDRLAGLLMDTLGCSRFAMLVVPDHWGQHPIDSGTRFAKRLWDWSDSGIEMFVDGWYHQDTVEHRGISGLKARYMTESEGEFLGLSYGEAARRMEAGRRSSRTWLYGSGAVDALRESAFGLAEDHIKVWIPQTGKVLARGPVITWASRSTARTASSLAFAALARQVLHPLRTVRVAVHPDDVTKDSIVASIEATLRCIANSRQVGLSIPHPNTIDVSGVVERATCCDRQGESVRSPSERSAAMLPPERAVQTTAPPSRKLSLIRMNERPLLGSRAQPFDVRLGSLPPLGVRVWAAHSRRPDQNSGSG